MILRFPTPILCCLCLLFGSEELSALVFPQTGTTYDSTEGLVDFPPSLQIGYLSPLSTGQSSQPCLTPIAPQWFIGAKHTIALFALDLVGPGSMKIHYKDADYTVTRIVSSANSDIVLLQISGSVPDYAPVYKKQITAGTPLTVYGEGSIGTTPIKTPGGVVLGWETANLDGRLRQGVGVAQDSSLSFPAIRWDFTPTSCWVDFADSGGPVFVGPALAGCISSHAFADGFATECGGTPQFDKNLFNPSQAITWILDQNQKIACFPYAGPPSSSTASSVYFELNWIYALISPPVQVDAGGTTSGWKSWIGTPQTTSLPIDVFGILNPAPQSVYQTANSLEGQPDATLEYRVDYLLTTEHYRLRLHFSSFWQPGGSLNEDVYINGSLVRANFDPAQAGQNKASVLDFSGVSPNGNAITIGIKPHNALGNAAISGLEVSLDTNTDLDNLVLPSNGGKLESFSSQLNATWAAANLTDGVTQGVGNSWSSTNLPTAPQDFIYSFKDHQIASLDSLKIYNYGETGTTNGSREIEFYGSMDAISWNLISIMTLAQQEGAQFLNLGGNPARFVKLSITSGYSTNYWKLGEVEIRGALQGGNILLPTNGGKLLSSTSQLDDNTWSASKLTDGVEGGVGYSWASAPTPSVPQEFVYSFQNGQLAFLNWAVLYNYGEDTGIYYSKNVEFYSSLDGVTWKLFSSAVLDQSPRPQIFNLNGTSTRYLKVAVKSGYSAARWDLGEIEVYGAVAIPNKPPTANPASFVTLEDTSMAITLTGSDPESSVLTFSLVTIPKKGALLGIPPNLIYVPNRDENGLDSFTFKVNDGIVDSAPASVSIAITPVNDPPVMAAIPNEFIFQNSGPHKVHLAVRAGPTNEVQGMTISVKSDNPAIIPDPTLDYTSPNNSGAITFNPAQDALGVVTIRMIIRDDGGTANGGVDTATNQFMVMVVPAPLGPNLLLSTNGGNLEFLTSERDDLWSANRLTDGLTGVGHSWASVDGPVAPQDFVYSFAPGGEAQLGWFDISNYGEQDGALASSGIDVSTSLDKTNWTKIITNAVLQPEGSFAFPLNGVLARFIKVSVLNGYSTNAWEVGEIALFQADKGGETGHIKIANFSTLTTTDQTWASGGSYTLHVNSANGPSGGDPGADLLQINGKLNITASSNSLFTIHLVSLGLNDLARPVYDFNNQSNYVWTVARTSGGISGLAPGKINLDLGSFSNSLGGGAFSLQVIGNDLQLQFVPVLASGNSFTWTAGAGTSDWFTPSNWSPAGVPSSTDSVTIESGTVNLGGDVTVANLTFSSGIMTGAGQLTVANIFNWSSGLLQRSGPTVIMTGATLNITSGNDHDLPGSTLTNYGTVTWTGGHIRGGENGSIIQNFGLWDAQIDSVINDDYGGTGVVFSNSGIFRKSAGTGAITMGGGVVFNNNALLDIQTGTFVLSGTGNSSGGRFNAASGATIDFNSDYGLNNGSSFTGTGTNLLTVGTLSLNGSYNSSNLRQTGGRLAGTNILHGAFNWSGGDWDGGGQITIATNCVLNILSPADHDISNSTLTNYGTVNWSGGRLRTGTATRICNFNLWNARVDADLNADFGAGAIFANAGAFHKSLATNSTTFQSGVHFSNTGVVVFDDGPLVFNDGATFQDSTVLRGASIALFQSGTFLLDGLINCTNVTQTGGTLLGTNLLCGAFNFSAGTWNSMTTLRTNSSLTILSAADHDFLNSALTNYGTVVWTGGRVRGGGNNGTSFQNFGLWDVQIDSFLNNDFGGIGVVFNNYGTCRKSAGAGTAAILGGVVFNNSGVLDIQTGTLTLSGGGHSAGGIFNAANAATINFAGDYQLNDSSSLTGSGTNLLSDGTLMLDGRYSSSNLRQTGGRLAGTNVLQGSFAWLGGDWDGAGLITIATNGTLNILSQADHDISNSTLTNYGTVNWSGGRLRTGTGARIYNFNLWNAQAGADLNADFGGGAVFANTGTFHKSLATNSTTFQSGIHFSNTGVLIVDDGPLVFNDGGAFLDGTVLTGASINLFQSGTFLLDGLINCTNAVQTGGSLIGTNLLNGAFSLSAGTWNSMTTLTTNSTLTILSASDHDFTNGALTNYGMIIWAGGRIRGGGNGGSFFHNFGLWDVQNDSDLNNDLGGIGVVFNNYGTLRKFTGAGTAAFLTGVASNTTTIQSGVSFNNSGVLDIQTGIITIEDNYNPAPTSQLLITLAGTNPGSGYGQLRVGESATLAGSLTLIQDTSFFPTNNAVFDLVLYPSQNGAFSAINGLHTSTADFTPSYTATSLSVTAAVTISGYEGDVSPRPNGRDNGTVSITSWVLIGRFVAGLDTPNPGGEFARADCAPRLSGTNLVRGNGIISITDWVQAGRYAAGLDSITPVGGPTGPITGPASLAPGAIHALAASGRVARLIGTALQPGITNTIQVVMDLQGDENAAGFSLAFDPLALKFVGISPGSDAPNSFLVNLNQSAAGRIGVAMAALPGQPLGAGAKTLVRLSVLPLANSSATGVSISFADFPIPRETANLAADQVETRYNAATFPFLLPVNSTSAAASALNIKKLTSGSYSIGLQGKQGTIYELQSSTDLLNWAGTKTLTLSTDIFQSVPMTNSPATSQFYRARRLP